MGLVIFDKDAPVLNGLEQSFSRESVSIGGMADAVASNQMRHAPPTQLRAVGPRSTALSGNYRLLGGNEVFVARNSGDNTTRVLRGNSDGTTTNLRTLTDGSTLAGGFRSLNAAFGDPATEEGFTDVEVSGNYAIGSVRGAMYAYGLLRVYTEIRKYNGSVWQPAQHAVWFSVDEGTSWELEHRSVDDAIGTERGAPWCMNPWPTPIYDRSNPEPKMLFCGTADYLSKAGSPTTGRFYVSAFVRAASDQPWSYAGGRELGVIPNVNHGHTACAVECEIDGYKRVQVLVVCGDGDLNNVIRRWLYESNGDIDPAVPATISGVSDSGNWTLDTEWTHGTAVASGRAVPGNQVTSMFAGQNEGEVLALYDNESGVFGRIVPGDDDSSAPVHYTRGPIHPGGGNISLYCSTNGRGRVLMTMWDDLSRNSDGTMTDFTGTGSAASRSPGVARIMYSDDWGESWCEVAKPANTDSMPAISNGRFFWNEGSSSVFTRVLPSLRAIRPASVSPGGTNIYVNHNQNDPAANLITWSGASSGRTFTPIVKSGGVFTDPDTLQVIPHPPCLTDTILKVTVAATGTQGYGQPAWGRRHTFDEQGTPVGQVDAQFWILPASDDGGVLVGCTSLNHSGGSAGSGLFLGGSQRTFSKVYGRDRWYPIYDATTQWPTAGGGVRICSPRWGHSTATPGAQTFYIVPGFGVKGGGGRTGQPIPLGSGGVAGTAPDEVLTVSGCDFGSSSLALRSVCRVPWDSWHEWCNPQSGGNDAGLTTRTLFRVYADADNWVVVDWEGLSHRIAVRVRSGGTTRTTLYMHSEAIGAMRETVIDIAIGFDGDDLAVACCVAGETETGTVTGGALFDSAIDVWRPGTDENGVMSAIEVLAVETFANGGDEEAMATILESIPADQPEPSPAPPRLRRLTGGSAATFRVRII